DCFAFGRKPGQRQAGGISERVFPEKLPTLGGVGGRRTEIQERVVDIADNGAKFHGMPSQPARQRGGCWRADTFGDGGHRNHDSRDHSKGKRCSLPSLWRMNTSCAAKPRSAGGAVRPAARMI